MKLKICTFDLIIKQFDNQFKEVLAETPIQLSFCACYFYKSEFKRFLN